MTTSLQVEAEHVHTQLGLHSRSPQKGRHPAVSQFWAGFQITSYPGNCAVLP
jgi:hypothetical protein